MYPDNEKISMQKLLIRYIFTFYFKCDSIVAIFIFSLNILNRISITIKTVNNSKVLYQNFYNSIKYLVDKIRRTNPI